jgi:hypothetical protein
MDSESRGAGTLGRLLPVILALVCCAGCAPGPGRPAGENGGASLGTDDFWSKANPTSEERRKGGGIPGSD